MHKLVLRLKYMKQRRPLNKNNYEKFEKNLLCCRVYTRLHERLGTIVHHVSSMELSILNEKNPKNRKRKILDTPLNTTYATQ